MRSLNVGLLAFLMASAPSVGAQPADVIFYNGQVLTLENQRIEQALALTGDRILAVGTNTDVLAMQDSETELVDLNGRSLLPGFVEGHSHILRGRPEGMSLQEAMETALRFGLTTLNELSGSREDAEDLLAEETNGGLRLRVNLFGRYNAAFLAEDNTSIIIEAWYPDQAPILDPERRLRIPGVKVFVDGAFTPGRGCWASTEPFPELLQNDPIFDVCASPRGALYVTVDELTSVITDAQDKNFIVAMHAMGDRGIETALAALETALDGEPASTYRHQIHHNSMLRPDQLPRYEALDVLASVRGYSICTPDTSYWGNVLGEDRKTWAGNRYALAGLDIHAFAEGDFGWTRDPDDRTSVRPIDPLLTLYGLITKKRLLEDDTICEPLDWVTRHAIPAERALRMLTIEPAFAVRQEKMIGSLAPDKFADLVILPKNPLTIDPDQIKDLSVLMTMVGGEVQFCAEDQEALCPTFTPTGVDSDATVVKAGYTLYPIYPNPASAGATIRFDLPKLATITLKVFNLLGQEMDTLISTPMSAGRHEVYWDTNGSPPGLYIGWLHAEGHTLTTHMVVLP